MWVPVPIEVVAWGGSVQQRWTSHHESLVSTMTRQTRHTIHQDSCDSFRRFMRFIVTHVTRFYDSCDSSRLVWLVATIHAIHQDSCDSLPRFMRFIKTHVTLSSDLDFTVFPQFHSKVNFRIEICLIWALHTSNWHNILFHTYSEVEICLIWTKMLLNSCANFYSEVTFKTEICLIWACILLIVTFFGHFVFWNRLVWT